MTEARKAIKLFIASADIKKTQLMAVEHTKKIVKVRSLNCYVLMPFCLHTEFITENNHGMVLK